MATRVVAVNKPDRKTTIKKVPANTSHHLTVVGFFHDKLVSYNGDKVASALSTSDPIAIGSGLPTIDPIAIGSRLYKHPASITIILPKLLWRTALFLFKQPVEIGNIVEAAIVSHFSNRLRGVDQ